MTVFGTARGPFLKVMGKMTGWAAIWLTCIVFDTFTNGSKSVTHG